MDTLLMCRICMVKDVKQHSIIDKNLQELFERLTSMPFQSKDNRPLRICYICRARLRNCHRLRINCLKSEELFTRFFHDNELKSLLLQDVNTMKIAHPLIRLSCEPVIPNDPDDEKIGDRDDAMVDPLEIKADVHVKEEDVEVAQEYIDQEADIQSTELDDIIKPEEVKTEDDDTLNEIFNPEQVDENYALTSTELDIKDVFKEDNSRATEAEDEINFTDIEETREADNKMSLTESCESMLLKTVKIVLTRIDMERINTSVPATMKPKLPILRRNTNSRKPETEVNCGENINILSEIRSMNKPRPKTNLKDSCKLNTQLDGKPHKCDSCEKCFRLKADLNKHKRKHTGGKPYKCDICDKCFRVHSALWTHLRTHISVKPYMCDMCKKCFSVKGVLVNHIRIQHMNLKSYYCDVCKKRFSAKRNLLLHIRIHSGERPYKCSVCEKSFRQKVHLNNHIGTHAIEKLHRCDVCQKCFGGRGAFKKHMRTHITIKPYQCDTCEKYFVQKSHLIEHILIHSGEKPHKCSVCGKCFSRKTNLSAHVRTHTGEKPFKCDVCQISFSRNTHLSGHIRTHAAEKPYKCDVCKKLYRRKDSLARHIRIHRRVV